MVVHLARVQGAEGFFYGLAEVYREILQDLDYRYVFEDFVQQTVLCYGLKGLKTQVEVNEESVLCQQWVTVYIYLGGPCLLLSRKCFLSTKVDKSTGVASVYPSYSDNIHLLPS